MKTRFVVRVLFFVTAIMLAACAFGETKSQTQDEVLAQSGIDDRSDYAVLSVCQQIDLYAQVGGQFLDIDHSIAIVPEWMNEEIAGKSQEEISDCIVSRGTSLLSELTDSYTSENENRVFQIHALIYKADELSLIHSSNLEPFVLATLCNEKVYYRGSLVILYYSSLPGIGHKEIDPEKALQTLCGR